MKSTKKLLVLLLSLALLLGTAGVAFAAGYDDGFVTGEVLAPAESRAQAQQIAAAYGLSLKSYAYGVAVLGAPDPAQVVALSKSPAAAALGQTVRMNLPQLSLNLLYEISDDSPQYPADDPSYTAGSGLSAAASIPTELYEEAPSYAGASGQGAPAPLAPVMYGDAPALAVGSGQSAAAAFSASAYGEAQWQHAILESERAWVLTKGAGVTVAVIDTGIDINHPKFAGQILGSSYNAYSGQMGLNYVQDDYGHGTHVSGIIAATQSGDPNMCGVAPEARIMAIKSNITGEGYFEEATLLRAINYAAANGADIINMSLGRSYYSGEDELEHATIAQAVANGVTIVCAAGNDGSRHASYPAAYPETIAVSALKAGGVFESLYSNYGPEIDVAAPGTDIYSTQNGGGYVQMSGTSMASPCAAGVAALIKSRHPEYTPGQVQAVLRGTARSMSSGGRDDYYGWGIANAYGAALGVERLYKVTYDFADGISVPRSIWVTPGGTLAEPDWPRRQNLVFGGWYTVAGAEFNFSSVINADMTLNAHWLTAWPGMFAVEFPDLAFCREVLKIVGGNKKISDIMSAADKNALASLYYLDIGYAGIADLQGLEYFSNIMVLDCTYNRLTKLDISKNTAMVTLWCYDNNLRALDLSRNPALTAVYCRYNEIESLNVSQNARLTTLDCRGNPLSSLDLSSNPALKTLWCGHSQLEKLNISKNPALTYVDSRCAWLREVDVTNNPALEYLICGNAPPIIGLPGDCQIETIDLSHNPALIEFGCQNTILKELDLSQNTKLEKLWCSGDDLRVLDISHNPRLDYIYMVENYLKTTDDVKGWQSIPALVLGSTLIFHPQRPLIEITVQPAAETTVIRGGVTGKLSIEVSATQDATLRYQWYRNSAPATSGGSIIDGANAAQYALPQDLEIGKYYYYCIVSAYNSAGTANVTSELATVIVNGPGGSGFVPVSDISLATDRTEAGRPLTLTGKVIPAEATHQDIGWRLKDPGSTGAYIADGVLYSAASGAAVVTATVKGGLAEHAISALAAGARHSLALTSDGKVEAWGKNDYGQLGDGTTTDHPLPVQVLIGDVDKIASGYFHTLAIKTDGSLWAWGLNNSGQLGDSSIITHTTPTPIGTDKNWLAIAAGAYFTIGLKSDGSLWSWGNNSNGQLGLGHYSDRSIPTRIGIDNDWAAIAAGYQHTAALKRDGSLWTWGYNAFGQLGDNTTFSRNTPARVAADTDWQAIAADGYHTLALKKDGSLWAWGHNGYGQLGDGATIQRSIPTRIGRDTDWSALAPGYQHTLAIKSDGSLWAWGGNTQGQLGEGTTASHSTPVQVGADQEWAVIATGNSHSLALAQDGSLWSWGWNAYGQLGDGAVTDRHLPARIKGATNFIKDFTITITQGQGTATYNGQVLYQTSPRPAKIELFGSNGALVDGAVSAATGAYTLSAPAGSGYTLVVTKPGYLSYTIRNLTLKEGESIETVDLRLLAGDINGDGIVDSVDVICLLDEYGKAPVVYPYADIDGNGIVDSADLLYLADGYGKSNVITIND